MQVTMKREINMLAMTCCAIDVEIGSDRQWVGGNAVNFAAAAMQCSNVRAYILGAVGNDADGERIRRVAAETGADVGHIHVIDQPTARYFYTLDNGDCTFFPEMKRGGAVDAYRISREDGEYLARMDVVDIFCFCPSLDEVLEINRERRFMLSIDMHLTRDEEWLRRCAKSGTVLFVRADEEFLPVLARLAAECDVVAVGTLGAQGSVAFFPSADTPDGPCRFGFELPNGAGMHYQAAEKCERVVDSNGCGDTFRAGFMCEYVQSGDIAAAMRCGATLAARKLYFHGGFQNMPQSEER